MSMIILDVETTWLDFINCSIISIWAIDLENPNNQFSWECRVFDWAKIEKQALKIIWFTEAQVKDPNKQSLKDLLQKFLLWMSKIEDKTVGWHNVWYFDVRFLEFNAKKVWIEADFGYRTLDLHSVAYTIFVKNWVGIPSWNWYSSLSLDAILSNLWLPKEPKPHLAINWAKFEAEAFSRLLFWKKIFKEFEKYNVK
jgi:DNA polymerase III alpha subunit (gram-positive type)